VALFSGHGVEGLSYLMLKTARSYLRLDETPKRGGQTDQRTDKQTDRPVLAVTAVCIASNADAL